jgi:hypothetical protein
MKKTILMMLLLTSTHCEAKAYKKSFNQAFNTYMYTLQQEEEQEDKEPAVVYYEGGYSDTERKDLDPKDAEILDLKEEIALLKSVCVC